VRERPAQWLMFEDVWRDRRAAERLRDGAADLGVAPQVAALALAASITGDSGRL